MRTTNNALHFFKQMGIAIALPIIFTAACSKSTVATAPKPTASSPAASVPQVGPGGPSAGLAAPPSVVATNLSATALYVATNRSIHATFDRPMDAQSVIDNFVLSPAVPGMTATYDVNSNRVIFGPASLPPTNGIGPATPAAYLAPNTQYTAMITTGAKDISGVPLAGSYVWKFQTGTDINELPIGLGLVSGFALFGGSTVSAGLISSYINGDFGAKGKVKQYTPNSLKISGTLYNTAGDVVLEAASKDISKIFSDAGSRNMAPVTILNPDLIDAGPLYPGTYRSNGDLNLNSDITLDARDDADAVFIFHVVGSLGLGSFVNIHLVNGATAANVFWSVTGKVTLGGLSLIQGTVMAEGDVEMNLGAKIEKGRMLTMASPIHFSGGNIITKP